jgi:hypothetical protein
LTSGIRAAADAVETALKEYADSEGGIEVKPGVRWSRREYVTERITINDSARQTLERELPGALQVSTSKEAIRRAAKAAGLDAKAVEKELLATLRLAGAVKATTTAKYDESSDKTK